MSNRLLGLLVVALLLTMPMFAQNNTGIISGRITDSSGAVVPNADITVTHTETGVDSVSKTNSDGLFRVPSLRDGAYRVIVVATGFKKLVRTGITLRIGENLNVEMKLDVGAVTESIDVINSIPLLDTQTSSSGQVMDGEYFYQLPNYQHWEKGVLYYTPQVQTTNFPWPGQLNNWNINGGQNWQTAQYEDGMLATSMDGNNSINSVSVGDAEIKVLTSAMPAEYGHATSGALIVVKKGGTNALHGEGGYLYKNDYMFHRRFFQLKTNPQQNIQTKFEMPDFVIGGPVYIPHIYNGKNKTFFSVAGSYHVDSSSNASSYTTPTAAMLAGDFSAYSNVIYDPGTTAGTLAAANLTRTPFTGNIIPASRFSTMWKNIAAANPFKAPTDPGSVNSTGPNNNIIASGTGNYFNLTNQFRVDHSFTDKLKVMASLTWGNQHQPQNNVNIVAKQFDQYQTLGYTIQNSAAVNFTYTIRPTLISETRVGEYRRTGNSSTLSGVDNTFSVAKLIPNLPANVYVNPIGLGLATEGTNGSNQLGVGTMGISVNNNHQFNQDFTMVKGTHAFKFGYEWLWENQVQHNIGNPRLGLNFGGTQGFTDGLGNTSNVTGGITIADLMLGYVTSYNYNQQGQSSLPVDSNHSFYFQDDWRVAPKLTLNLGVRYNTETPPHSKFPGGLSIGSLSIPDPYYGTASVPNVLTCPTGGCIGGYVQPKGFLWKRDNNNFQPRFGLAWNVEQNTVIRGGFALMQLDWNLGVTNQAEIGGGNFYNQNVSQPNQPSNLSASYPLFQIDKGVPAFVPQTPRPDGTILQTASSPSGRPTINIYPDNYHNPYVLNWNVSIQHAIKKNYVVELSYVGMHNVGFGGSIDGNSRPFGTGIDAAGNVINLADPANVVYRNGWVGNGSAVNGTQAYKRFPNLGGVSYQCNCVSMIYHSGTIKMEKRYSYGLSFLAFFTYQKGLTTNWNNQNTYLPISVGRSVTGQTQKYRFVSSMTYELPIGKGKRFMSHGRLKDWLFGGYSLAWNYSVWAPTPMSTGYSNANIVNPATGKLGGRQGYPGYEPQPGSGLFRLQDPVLRANWQDIGTNRFVQTAQNPTVTNCGVAPILYPVTLPDGTTGNATYGNNCVAIAPSFINGNMPANTWIDQRIIGANASFYKDFPIKERFKAQIRLDYFNPFKWFNWNRASTTMDQNNPKNFMTPGLGDAGDSTEGGPGLMQVSFRVRF